MFTAALLKTWKPRHTEAGFVDVSHSYELTSTLTAELLAMGVEERVARLAAGSFVNCQDERDFGLIGSHGDVHRGSRALGALEAWAARQTMKVAA